MKMNNKGQVLVITLLLIPIISIVLILTVDLADAYITKKKIDSINMEAVRSGMKLIASPTSGVTEYYTDQEIKDCVLEVVIRNLKDIQITSLTVTNGQIKLAINGSHKNNFRNIIARNKYDITSSYIGYYDNEDVIIRKEK